MTRMLVRTAAAGFAAAIAVALSVSPAAAVEPDEVGVYPTWTTAGTSAAYTASPVFPSSAGFPAVAVTSDATGVQAPGGASSYYNATTAFGAEYGSSRYQPYLLISTGISRAPSTTDLTIAGDPPAGWGFALGDVDADWVFVQAWQDEARTVPLTIDELGFQGAENACVGSPRPAACSTPGLLFESPVWVTAEEDFDGITYAPSTLRGSTLRSDTVTTLDSTGAYGWFQPTAPVRSLSLLFGPRDGFPTYTLTLASPAPKTTVTGTLTPPAGTTIPSGTTISVADAGGEPLLDLVGEPLVVPVAGDGSYSFEAEQRDAYTLDPTLPEGYVDIPPFTVAADTAEVVVPPIAVSAEPAPAPSPTPSVDGDPSGLAESGVDLPAITWIAAGIAIVVGAGAVVMARSNAKRRETKDADSPDAD